MCSRLASLAAGLTLLLSALPSAQASSTEDVAPGLADDALVNDASDQLRELVATLDGREQRAIEGIYVAIDASRTEVTAMPACDDDGDYVVVLSRGLLDLVRDVAYADASDRLRGTRLLPAYGALLARAQQPGARPLPSTGEANHAGGAADATIAVAQAFVDDALGWLVADEVAREVSGEVMCPRPTATRERGDDDWTPSERAEALARAPARMTAGRGPAADAWATARLLARGGSEVPAAEVLDALAPLEEARPRGETWGYLALHPGSRERADAVRVGGWEWREERAGEAGGKSSAAGATMR